jgi:putative peptidoglycan lipid II flippase
VGLASVALGGVLVVAQQRIDWLALGAHGWWRAALMAAVLALAAGVYLGALRLGGLRLKQFVRRG